MTDQTPLQISDIGDGVRRLTLNRPEARNALNTDLLQALHVALEQAREDKSCRVIILDGAGPVFCAGLDLKEAMDPEKAHASAALVHKTLIALSTVPQLTIAAVQKAAIAGGAGLMSACDLALCSDDVQIGYPEVYRGLVAGLVMHFLMQQVSGRHARELLLLGLMVDAGRAYEMGLVNKVVPAVELADTAVQIARLALKGGPKSIAATKQMMEALTAPTLDENMKTALNAHLQARGSDEAAEGIRAFLEKRFPEWDPAAGVRS